MALIRGRKRGRPERLHRIKDQSLTLRLPMQGEDAAALARRARLALERLRNGDIERRIISDLAQVVLLATFITEAGYGKLGVAHLECVERDIAYVLLHADSTGTWQVSDALLRALTQVVNEYDRTDTDARDRGRVPPSGAPRPRACARAE